jgi:hypothetical protein
VSQPLERRVDERRLLAIKDRAAERLLGLPGVHAVGIGGELTGGKPTGEVAIVVFVEAKRPPGEVPVEELIPAEIEGVRTDVVEQAPPSIQAG